MTSAARPPPWKTPQHPSAPQIHRRHLFAPMSHLLGDHQPHLMITNLLLWRELLRGWPATGRTRPTGLLPIARLGILVPQAVHVVDARLPALALEALQLVLVAQGLRDQAALPGQRLRLVEEGALRGGTDGISRARPPLVQEAWSASLSPRSANSGRIRIDSWRRSPNSAWKRRDRAL